MPAQLAGAVLCGGLSRRMGDDKALMQIEGEPMFARAARVLAEVAEPVILARGSRPLPDLGWGQIEDSYPGSGPLGGLVTGLKWAPHELLAVVAADMPFVSAPLFEEMVAAWNGQDAVVPFTDDGTQPLHALYARSALGHLEARLKAGGLRLRDAVADLNVLAVDARNHDRFDSNLNSPKDLGVFGFGEDRTRDL